MDALNSNTFVLKFPGDVDYIPAVRKFVAETLAAANFSAKFAYRSEIIVDEICHNAVTFGCQSDNAVVDLSLKIQGDQVEFEVRDPGKGEDSDRERLKMAVGKEPLGGAAGRQGTGPAKGRLGLEIVKMLSEKLDFEVDSGNLTSVRVMRRREDAEVVKQA